MKKKIIIGISLIIVIAILSVVLVFLKTDEPKINYTNDELKFKDEYEKLNGTENNDTVLKDIDIYGDNNIKYVKDDEIIDLLTNGTNIIYFGWADCNWCRTAVPVLLEVLKDNNIDTLYYYDFKSLRDAYENLDEEKSTIYENIINIIGEQIETTFEENSDRAGQKKLSAPTVVFIKNGTFVGLHTKTVESHKDSSKDLTEEQTKELKRKYQSLIDILNASVCVTDEGC